MRERIIKPFLYATQLIYRCVIAENYKENTKFTNAKPLPKIPENCHDARTLLFYRLPGCLPCQMQRDLFLAFDGVTNES